jgi:hypothetical protein
MPPLLLDRPSVDTFSGRSSRRRRVPVKLIAAGAVVAGAAVGINAVGDWIAGWGDPTEPRVIDRSPAPLLLALDDLSEYHAATATLRVDVDREIDTPWLPSVISGERVTFQATGTADAYVDFEGMDAGAVTLSPDGTSATITLPAPQLAEVRIDPEQSRVVDRDRGLVERVGAVFAENPTDDSALYALAEDKLAAAAARSDVLDRAESNTRDMLTTLAKGFGVDEVTVEFEEPTDSGS